MTRWVLLAIAFVVAGCSEGDRDRVSREGSEAAATADSALRADQDTTETGAPQEVEADRAPAAERADTGRTSTARAPEAPPAGRTAEAPRGPTGAEAMGGVRGVSLPRELSADQVRRLQAALNDAGCEAGPADGVLGRRTRQAIACGLEKHDLSRNDLDGLYRSLGLDF